MPFLAEQVRTRVVSRGKVFGPLRRRRHQTINVLIALLACTTATAVIMSDGAGHRAAVFPPSSADAVELLFGSCKREPWQLQARAVAAVSESRGSCKLEPRQL